MDVRAWPTPFIAGVSLTYDGARPEHLDHAIPELERARLKGTFFIESGACAERIAEWRGAVELGHELGNGFLSNSTDSDGLIPHWPSGTLEDECRDADELIETISGRKPTSFAHPCVRTEWSESGIPVVSEILGTTIMRINDEALAPLAASYTCARVPQDGFNPVPGFNPKRIRCYVADQLDGDSLCVLAHLGISQGAWVVFTFSGLRINPFLLDAHAQFVQWLAERRESVMVGTISEVVAGFGLSSVERGSAFKLSP